MSFFTRKPLSLNTLRAVLATGEVAVKGETCCIDTATGEFKVAQDGVATLVAIGTFTEGLTGNGTLTTLCALFEEVRVQEWLNAAPPNNLTAAERGSTCYLLDGRTVTKDSVGNSPAGMFLQLDDNGRCMVAAGLSHQGATGASGRSGTVATRTALAAIAAASRADGQVVTVLSDGSSWRFVAASAVTMDGASAAVSNIAITPAAGTGRWIRNDQNFTMKLPIGFGTADAASLCTVPTGFCLRLTGLPFWDVVTPFAGGAASAIGISSDQTGSSTKGDLLGGATGDVEATLVAGVIPGTIGAKQDTLAEQQAVVVPAGKKLRFDRITSVFTSGAGYVQVPVALSMIG